MRNFPGGFGSFLASGAKNQSLLALCEELRVEYKSSLLTAVPSNNAKNCNKGHESNTESTKNVFLPFYLFYSSILTVRRTSSTRLILAGVDAR